MSSDVAADGSVAEVSGSLMCLDKGVSKCFWKARVTWCGLKEPGSTAMRLLRSQHLRPQGIKPRRLEQREAAPYVSVVNLISFEGCMCKASTLYP